MNTSTKQQISSALKLYIDNSPLSQNQIADKSGVSGLYLAAIASGKESVKVGAKMTEISPKWYKRIANFIDFAFEKQYWETKPTAQMKDMLATLEDAKAYGSVATITGVTGCGKTYVLDLFARANPADVFSVKVGQSDNLSDLLDKVLEKIGVSDSPRSKSARIRTIIKFMKKLAENGYDPTLAFDEAENMKLPALCAMKELIDNLKEWCAIVLIGTEQLQQNLEKLKKKNKQGMPQLYRRIKFGMRALPAIDRRYSQFTSDLPKDLQKWLQQNCDNYGELHDVLVPCRREAERTGQVLDLEFAKIVLGFNDRG